MSEAPELTYMKLMNEVDEIVRNLQKCNDVDEAMRLFEKGTESLKMCEKRIEAARGKFVELTGS